MNQIVVVGSINMDIVTEVERFPQPGETIRGIKTAFNPGGKGANQAVAAVRAGGKVKMIGAVGDDPFGKQLVRSLANDGIETNAIMEKDCTSGIAFITVDSSGENNIILEPGANGKINEEDVTKVFDFESNKDSTILLQNEIPWGVTESIICSADKEGVPVYLNPAPARNVTNEILSKLTGIFLNEKEAGVISGIAVTDVISAEEATSKLVKTGLNEIIITLGEKGSYYADRRGSSIYTPANKVKAVDTTAAGDTFVGAYVVARSSGKSTPSSIEFATAASSLTVSREGAQKSIPNKEEVDRYMKEML